MRWVALDDVDEAALNAASSLCCWGSARNPNTFRHSIGNWWKNTDADFLPAISSLKTSICIRLHSAGGDQRRQISPASCTSLVSTIAPSAPMRRTRPSVANALEERLMLRLLNHPQFRDSVFSRP